MQGENNRSAVTTCRRYEDVAGIAWNVNLEADNEAEIYLGSVSEPFE